MNRQDKTVVLFSGGCDSVLTASIAASSYSEVYLLTYKRWGLFMVDISNAVRRLEAAYLETKFIFKALGVDEFFKEVCYEDYFKNIAKFGSMVLSICALCKLSMHYRTILFCLENNIRKVLDGTVEVEFASEDFLKERVNDMKQFLKGLYLDFGIDYGCPVYGYELGEVEKDLYRKGLAPEGRIRGGRLDKQPVCVSHLLNACFGDYYLYRHSKEKFVKDSSRFYQHKIEYVRKRIKERIDEEN